MTAIYGTVTNGIQWKFLRLQGDRVEIDLTDRYIIRPDKILGGFKKIVEEREMEGEIGA